jgi:hypothetical protein
VTAQSGAATVVSIAVTGTATLTLTRKGGVSNHSANINGTPWLNCEIWWARATADMSAAITTAVMTTGPSPVVDNAAIFAFLVNGCGNPSAPGDTTVATNEQHTNTSTPVNFSNFNHVTCTLLLQLAGSATLCLKLSIKHLEADLPID